MKFLIVTPVRNGKDLLERTMRSVLEQSRSDEIDITYFVSDAQSDDGTQDVLRRFRDQSAMTGLKFDYSSEPDLGMYDAIVNAFERYSHERFDVYGYINAGDFYAPRAFYNLSSLFKSGAHWLTGINVRYNEAGDIVGARLPGPYPRKLIAKGIFGLFLPCIQQESTLWSDAAHATIDLGRLRGFKLAGDFFIWQCIAKKYSLKVLSLWISGFTVHEGQLSEVRRAEYVREIKSSAEGRGVIDFAYAVLIGLCWLVPDSWKFRLYSQSVLRFMVDN